MFIVALVAVLLLAGCASGATSQTGGAGGSAGKTIFDTGSGHAGPIQRSMMGAPATTSGLPCAGCHGAAGQGTGIAPSITRSTLGSKHTITHKPSAADPSPQPVSEGPWTPAQTVEVARTGVTPEGNHLGGRMPLWQLDSQDADALAQYLGQL
jgi:mono/diheme cytochrome c family protein